MDENENPERDKVLWHRDEFGREFNISSYIATKIGSVTSRIFCISTSDGRVMMEAHLDSHANMVLLGPECHILSTSEHNASVSGWSDQVSMMEQVPIVDAVVAHDDPATGKSYLFVV